MSLYGEQRYDASKSEPHVYALRTKGARTLYIEHAPLFVDAPHRVLVAPLAASLGGVYVWLGDATGGAPWTYVLGGRLRVIPVPVAIDYVTIIPAPGSSGVVIVSLSDSEHAPAVYATL